MEDEFTRERAALMARRARGLCLVLLVLWVPLYLFADPTFMPSRTFSTVVRAPTAAGLIALYVFLTGRHSRRAVEWAVLCTFSALALTWGWVIYNAIPGQELPPAISVLVLSVVISIATMLSPLGTILLICVGNLSVVVAGAWRLDPPDSSYFGLVASSMSVGFPIILFAAITRDRTDRAAFNARTALARANEELKKQERLRTELFTNLSHDLRTPLAVLRAELATLSNEREHNSLQRYESMARMGRNISATADLLDQLLELARLDTGKVPHDPVPFDLCALVKLVVAQLEPAERGVALRPFVPSEVVAVAADPRHVRRILTNLVANALRAVGKRGTVEVELHSDGSQVRLAVIDDGPGIPKEMQQRLFTRFSSFAREGSTASGIGLALARELAQLNGGNLEWVASAAKTTFQLTLPGAEATKVAALSVLSAPSSPPPISAIPLASQKEQEGETAPASMSRRVALSPCLLIVEDNDDLRASLLALLQPRFEIALASTLSEALAVLERVVPDAVLSDIMLPDGDGYELLRRVRATDPLKRVPVLMVSARGEAAERARGLSAGADDYLAKPFDPEELTARIESAIERARTAAQSLQEHRQLISRELHDGPGGSLARSALLLEEALTTTAAERSRQLVGDALAAVREGIDELRLLLSMTKGQQHDWGTLTETIESDLAIGCAASALRLQFSASPAGDESGEFSVPTAVAHALRRIMREALTNVIKHAKATRVECVLRLDRAAGQIQLRFEDDGSGLTGQAGDGHGIGIMKQRAATCGGSLQIEKGVPSGTCVVATLNLDSGAERALSLAG